MEQSGPTARDGPERCASCGSLSLRLLYRLRLLDVFECEECTIRFRYPLPSEGELIDMYEDPEYHESAYFDNAHAGYRSNAPEIRIYRRGLQDLERLGAPGRLLDVGCARGVFLDLARRAGWPVVGIELSETHASYARKQFGLEVWSGDFLQAPFEAGTFTAITMWDFLEHVLDPRAVLGLAHRLLAPDGVLLVFTIDSASLFNRIASVAYLATGGRLVRPLELLYDARHNYYFTRRALKRLVESSDFRIERWRADRAYLGRWVSEPAPSYLVAGGFAVDVASVVVGRQYRHTALCRKSLSATGD